VTLTQIIENTVRENEVNGPQNFVSTRESNPLSHLKPDGRISASVDVPFFIDAFLGWFPLPSCISYVTCSNATIVSTRDIFAMSTLPFSRRKFFAFKIAECSELLSASKRRQNIFTSRFN
jgi:hypothetical protein